MIRNNSVEQSIFERVFRSFKEITTNVRSYTILENAVVYGLHYLFQSGAM